MSLDQEAKTKLAILVKSIEPIVEKQLEEFSSAEVEYVLSNFREYLKYDLTRDFEKIRENGFTEYVPEVYTDTCKRYDAHDKVHDLWQNGIQERLLVPAFHGREHLNEQRWMRALQSGCQSTLLAFDHGVTGISRGIDGVVLGSYQAAFDIDTLADLKYQNEVLKTGLDIFEKLYGYRSKFFIPTNGPFNNELEPIVKSLGIDYLGTSKIQLEPLGNNQYKRHVRYLGKKSHEGLMYMTRNAFFEPNSWEHPRSKDWVHDCLKEIDMLEA